jgi:hypothetical protein
MLVVTAVTQRTGIRRVPCSLAQVRFEDWGSSRKERGAMWYEAVDSRSTRR